MAEKAALIQRVSLTVGIILSLLLIFQMVEGRLNASLYKCQADQEARIRILEKAYYRQSPILEALGRRLKIELPPLDSAP